MTLQELDAKQKIIKAGSKLFAEKGFDGTSTRDIAKESGVNLSLISYYFGGKEGLYKEVLIGSIQEFKFGIDRIIQEFDNESLNKEGFTNAILALVDAFFEMRDRNEYIFTIYSREQLAGLPFSFEVHKDIFKSIADSMEAFIKKAQKKGFINPDLNTHYFLGSLVDTIVGYFIHHDCCAKMVQDVFNLPENKKEFKKQISLIFLKGIFQ